jgi:predicted dehydrogenase
MVAQNYRFQPGVQTIRRFMAQGKLGNTGYASVRFHKGPHFGGFREQMAYPLVLDMSIHHIDMARCFFDTDVKAVQAVSISAPWNWNKGDATVMAVLEMANGVTLDYCGSWVAQGAETSWNADWRFDGDKGALLWEGDALTFSPKPDSSRVLKPVSMKRTGQAAVLEAFRKAVETGDEPETSGRRNLNSLAATFAVVTAAKEKRRVLVRDLLK